MRSRRNEALDTLHDDLERVAAKAARLCAEYHRSTPQKDGVYADHERVALPIDA